MSASKSEANDLSALLVSIARDFERRNNKEATIRYLAKRARERQRTVLDALEDRAATEADICINVGERCGNGIYTYTNIGDYSVSYLGN